VRAAARRADARSGWRGRSTTSTRRSRAAGRHGHPAADGALLRHALARLAEHEAVLGLASDGGWWALGLQRPDGSLLRDVPTSRDDTGSRQLAALRGAGLEPHLLPELRDVDTADDARAVAQLAPDGRFGRLVSEVLG
jgi:glycosyltransferase A (GT-A) superfamily protein (DUF2064 family)